MMSAIKKQWRNSPLRAVYNARDEQGRGRLCAMVSLVLQLMVSNLTSSLFYTGFLLEYGMDITRIGILNSIPYIACMFSMLSPVILERFAKRKWILFAGKLGFYTINILCVTLLPMVVRDADARLVSFVILIFIANVLNQLVTPGYLAWRANFLPDEVRVDFFSSANCITYAVANIVALLISMISDRFSGTEYELTVLTGVRFFAYLLAIADCVIWLLPKEWPYSTQSRTRLTHVLTLPLQNRKFLLTILMLTGYTFATNLPVATLHAYLMESVGISYTLYTGIDATFFLFYFFLTRPCKQFIARYDWIPSFGFVSLFIGLVYFAQAFVNANTIWLFVLVRIAMHMLGVPLTICQESLLYVHLPDEGRTNYISFYSILNNFMALIARLIGAAVTAAVGTRTINLFGYAFESTPLLMLLTAAFGALIALACFRLSKMLKTRE